jgi:hypothetical protein
MKNPAQPTPFSRRRRRGRNVLTDHGPSHKDYQNEQKKAALHEALNSPKTFLGCKIGVKPFMNSRMSSQSIGMRTLCVFVFCLAFALVDAAAKERHCTFRVHAQANPQDTEVFSIAARATSSGKDVAIEKMAWITEHDVMAFSPYPAKDGTFGALFQLDDHGRVVLDTLSVERRGRFLFVFINGRMITELQIDKRVSDGRIYVPAGLTAADVELMKKEWRLPGQPKR